LQSFNPELVLLDLAMPQMDGLQTLEHIKQVRPEASVLIVAGQGKPDVVFRASKLGAEDFITKPFEPRELEIRMQKVIERRQLVTQVNELRRQVRGQQDYSLMLGNAPKMEEVRRMVERVADTDVTVLIRGESGTGKEVVARMIYSASDRREQPFVKVNCAAIPHELLESELFGYESGAFTGATRQKIGKFEMANHGTIFLDEISEMHPALQAKLLHVLQDGEFSRLGAKHNISVNVRVLAATNVNLESAVAEGRFREDLFYRLNVVTIQLPPLRDRTEDIPLLLDYFRTKYSAYYGRHVEPFSDPALARLLEYHWPGNIRELENLVKRYVIMGNETAILRELAPPRFATTAVAPSGATIVPIRSTATPAASAAAPMSSTPAAPKPGSLENRSLLEIGREAAQKAERETILRVLNQTRWNRRQAAKILRISYKALHNKLKLINAELAEEGAPADLNEKRDTASG
jgi:DNA-binding NtrC family response regulator